MIAAAVAEPLIVVSAEDALSPPVSFHKLQIPQAFSLREFHPENEIEQAVLDSEPFRRLLDVRQLSVSFSSRGRQMEYSRAQHSMMVATLAGDSAAQLGVRAEERSALRLAGLLHDVGHGPFAHACEAAMQAAGFKFDHEATTARIIQEEYGRILGDKTGLILDLLKNENVPKHPLSWALDYYDRLSYLTQDYLLSGFSPEAKRRTLAAVQNFLAALRFDPNDVKRPLTIVDANPPVQVMQARLALYREYSASPLAALADALIARGFHEALDRHVARGGEAEQFAAKYQRMSDREALACYSPEIRRLLTNEEGVDANFDTVLVFSVADLVNDQIKDALAPGQVDPPDALRVSGFPLKGMSLLEYWIRATAPEVPKDGLYVLITPDYERICHCYWAEPLSSRPMHLAAWQELFNEDRPISVVVRKGLDVDAAALRETIVKELRSAGFLNGKADKLLSADQDEMRAAFLGR